MLRVMQCGSFAEICWLGNCPTNFCWRATNNDGEREKEREMGAKEPYEHVSMHISRATTCVCVCVCRLLTFPALVVSAVIS